MSSFTEPGIGIGINLGVLSCFDLHRDDTEDTTGFELDKGGGEVVGSANTWDGEAGGAEKTWGWDEDTPVSNFAILRGCSFDSLIYLMAVSSFFQPCFLFRSTEVAPCKSPSI